MPRGARQGTWIIGPGSSTGRSVGAALHRSRAVAHRSPFAGCDGRVTDVDDGIDQLIERQHGLITRRQAVAIGLTDKALRCRAATRWQRVLPGVYAAFTGPVDDDLLARAALLLAGPDAQLHAVTAARRYQIRYLPNDPRTHLLVPHAKQLASTPTVVVHRTHRLPRPLVVNGLPCVPAARAVVDLSRVLPRLRDVRAVVADAVHRRYARIDALELELAQGHSAGSALVRRAVADLVAGCRSAPECELRDLVSTSRILPEPCWNAPVRVGGRLLGIADAWWPEVRMAAEVNSRQHHFAEEDWESTMQRQAGFAAHGILVVPVSPARLRASSTAVLRELESGWLSRRAS